MSAPACQSRRSARSEWTCELPSASRLSWSVPWSCCSLDFNQASEFLVNLPVLVQCDERYNEEVHWQQGKWRKQRLRIPTQEPLNCDFFQSVAIMSFQCHWPLFVWCPSKSSALCPMLHLQIDINCTTSKPRRHFWLWPKVRSPTIGTPLEGPEEKRPLRRLWEAQLLCPPWPEWRGFPH